MNAFRSKNQSGTMALLGCVVGIATIWLIVLPATANLPIVRSHLEFLESHRVNAAAMFYTELEPKDSFPPTR
ncbi:MAG: hypothetical protein FJ308_05975 [Planctomycetes bacterium]|nr:hypothetical protein [Planctomycetota bacterium]